VIGVGRLVVVVIGYVVVIGRVVDGVG